MNFIYKTSDESQLKSVSKELPVCKRFLACWDRKINAGLQAGRIPD